LDLTIIIPAYNEAPRIARTVNSALPYAQEVIVVDDGSSDRTAVAAERAGARVVRQAKAGYIAAIKRGFREASGQIVVTMDGDGEHRARDIPRLVAPIVAGEADLVLGRRPQIARPSERVLNWLARRRVRSATDTGTGFRALRRELALKLALTGRCTCGVLALEAAARGARITEVPIGLEGVEKRRRIAWPHLAQMWYVVPWLIRPGRKGNP
jgi:glycosyltransferase involved in cell wall biosynthesis